MVDGAPLPHQHTRLVSGLPAGLPCPAPTHTVHVVGDVLQLLQLGVHHQCGLRLNGDVRHLAVVLDQRVVPDAALNVHQRKLLLLQIVDSTSELDALGRLPGAVLRWEVGGGGGGGEPGQQSPRAGEDRIKQGMSASVVCFGKMGKLVRCKTTKW